MGAVDGLDGRDLSPEERDLIRKYRVSRKQRAHRLGELRKELEKAQKAVAVWTEQVKRAEKALAETPLVDLE